MRACLNGLKLSPGRYDLPSGMQFRTETDCALRVLVYFALRFDAETHPGFLPLSEGARFLGLPEGEVTRAGARLVALGFLTARGGRRAGVRLAAAPRHINLGQVIEALEGHSPLLVSSPFDADDPRAPLERGLRQTLDWTARELHRSLRQYTLDQLLPRYAEELVRDPDLTRNRVDTRLRLVRE